MFQILGLLKIFILILISAIESEGYKVRSISPRQFEWAHNPFWDVKKQILYFADIRGGTINSYKPSTRVIHSASVVTKPNETCSLIIPIVKEKNKFVVTIQDSVTNLTWDGTSNSTGKPTLVVKLSNDSSVHTLTGKADPMGRLWVGTVGAFNAFGQPSRDKAAEYMITAGGKAVIKITNISIADGIAWNAANTTFYFVDAYDKQIRSYDYDNDSGDISNKKIIFDTKANGLDGFPTGMTIDTEGNLWIAQFLSGKVIQIDPKTGDLLRTVDMPAQEVTNLAFGGENLDVLYVTSANIFKDAAKPTKYSGRLFSITGLKNSGKPATGYPGQKIAMI